MKKSLLASHFILVAILIFAPAALAQKLVIAWTAVSAFNSPFWIMSDAGLYKEEGLDVDTMYIASSPIAAKATLAGEVVISAQIVKSSGFRPSGRGFGRHRHHGQYRAFLCYGCAGDKQCFRLERQNRRSFSFWRGD